MTFNWVSYSRVSHFFFGNFERTARSQAVASDGSYPIMNKTSITTNIGAEKTKNKNIWPWPRILGKCTLEQIIKQGRFSPFKDAMSNELCDPTDNIDADDHDQSIVVRGDIPLGNVEVGTKHCRRRHQSGKEMKRKIIQTGQTVNRQNRIHLKVSHRDEDKLAHPVERVKNKWHADDVDPFVHHVVMVRAIRRKKIYNHFGLSEQSC